MAYLVEESEVAIAFGLVACLTNLGTTVSPPFMGWLHDSSVENAIAPDKEDGYFNVIIVFVIMSILCLLIRFALLYWDQKVRGGVLDSKDIDE